MGHTTHPIQTFQKDAAGKIVQQSRLIRLPSELRNMIYELVLCEPKPSVIILGRHKQPGLTMTCRQLRGEALPMFYGLNTFLTCEYEVSRKSSIFFQWLTGMKNGNTSLLRNIVVTDTFTPGSLGKAEVDLLVQQRGVVVDPDTITIVEHMTTERWIAECEDKPDEVYFSVLLEGNKIR